MSPRSTPAVQARPEPSARHPSKDAEPAAVHFRVELLDPHAHLYRVTLQLAQPQAGQTLQLPAWIPGSYLLREFSRHLQGMRAEQHGHAVALAQRDKHTWHADCQSGAPLELRYEVYAADNSVRSAWLDASRAFFNGTSLFLRALGHEDVPHSLDIVRPAEHAGWEVATALQAQHTDAAGFGRYRAADYD